MNPLTDLLRQYRHLHKQAEEAFALFERLKQDTEKHKEAEHARTIFERRKQAANEIYSKIKVLEQLDSRASDRLATLGSNRHTLNRTLITPDTSNRTAPQSQPETRETEHDIKLTRED